MFRAEPLKNPKELADAQETSNNGRTPVLFDLQKIATRSATIGFTRNDLLAEVIAHEAGHKFGRGHPLRPSCCSFVQTNQQGASAVINMTNYGMPTPTPASKTVFVKFEEYQDAQLPNLGWIGADSFGNSDDRRIVGQQLLNRDQAGIALYRLTLNEPLTGVGWIQNQEQKLMDWTPRTTLRNGPWAFNPLHQSKFCVHPLCNQ